MADINDSAMIHDYMNSTKVKCCDYETLPEEEEDARDDIIYAAYNLFELGVDFYIYYCHKWVWIDCLLQDDMVYKDVHNGILCSLERYKLAARALKSLNLKDSEYPLIFKHMINDTIDTSIDFDMLRLNNNFAMRSDVPKAYYSSKRFLEENNITVDKQYVSLEDVLHRELFSEEELLKFRMLLIYGYMFNKEMDGNTRELLLPIAAKLMLEVRRKYENMSDQEYMALWQ